MNWTTLLRAGATLVVASVVFITVTECSDSSAPHGQRTVYGPAVPMGNGTATGYVTLDDQQSPVAVGAALTTAALSGLPSQAMSTEFVVPLPSEAAVTSVDHIVINWNPHGHPPAGIYAVPHFDVHLYQITEATRATIGPRDPGWTAKIAARPPVDQVPPGYVKDPNGIPRMGVHWADTSDAQYHGHPFTSTFIYGSYAGAFIFYEPMIALSYLQSMPTRRASIPFSPKPAKPGFYPTGYSVLSNASMATIRIQADSWQRF